MTPLERSSIPPQGTDPVMWRYTNAAWRLNQRLTRRHIDLALRFRSARALPAGFRARFVAMGMTAVLVDDTLGEVRSLNDWADAWIRAAQRALGESRRYTLADRPLEAAADRRLAAMAYHVAQLFVAEPQTARAMRAAATTLFGQALPLLMPDTHPVAVPWRAASLPGYLRVSRGIDTAAPLVVLLNGTTTTKEETILWSDRFIANGCAVLAVDTPGTGEARHLGPHSADHDDLLDDLPGLLRRESWFRPDWIAVAGISLGGAQAVRVVATNRRLAACIAVTPPFAAAAWISKINPVLRDQLAAIAGCPPHAQLRDMAETFTLREAANRIRVPLLVLGAGHDLVVPPEEAIRLAASAPAVSTLIWHPDAGHALYDRIESWTDDAARWLRSVLPDVAPLASTRVDAFQHTSDAHIT